MKPYKGKLKVNPQKEITERVDASVNASKVWAVNPVRKSIKYLNVVKVRHCRCKNCDNNSVVWKRKEKIEDCRIL